MMALKTAIPSGNKDFFVANGANKTSKICSIQRERFRKILFITLIIHHTYKLRRRQYEKSNF